MNRSVSLALTIIRDAKLPAVLDVRASFPGVDYRYTWGPAENVGLVKLNVKDLEAHAEAFQWISQHPDIRVVDALTEDPGPEDNGTTEYLVVALRDLRAATARRNALELRDKAAVRRSEAHKDLLGSMPAAMHVDYYMGKIIQWETERDAWQKIADRPQEFRAVFSSAVVDLINGLGSSANELEDALRSRQLEGLRTFVRRARVYMDAEDAVDALLSF